MRKTTVKPKSGRTRLNLHQRIGLLPQKHAALRDALLAIKWLGNAGAHEAEMSRDEVYDAFDILEFVLKQLYEADHRAVERLVKKVNQRKGPQPSGSRRRIGKVAIGRPCPQLRACRL